jgi:LCP family protein required for cell wall assembly
VKLGLRRGQRGPRTGKRHWLRWTSVGVVVILGAGSLGAYLKYRAVYDSIKRDPLTNLGKRPPQYSTSSMNVLVYGSDSRAGLTPHQQYILHTGHVSGNNTDTIMLVHISPGRHKVAVLSIPRDTMVPAYECDRGPGYPGQQANPNQYEMINSLLAIGGPSCLFKTVEQQTGIFINHFIGLGLVGFVKVINDVGGVNVCVPFAVNNSVSGLNLPAGKDHITGVQALAFWRTREDIGNGSDLQRIQRDQFMSAQIVKAVLGSDLLGNPLRLYHVVSDAAAAMTTDSGMSASDLISIANSFRGLNSKNVQFITAPNETYPADVNRVQFAQPQASEVFSAIAHDVTVPKTKPTPATAPSGGAQVLTTSPSKVKLEVLNGSGAYQAAGSAAAALAARGFDVTGTGNAANFRYTASVIEYASAADKPAVNTLKKEIAGVTVRQVTSLTPGTIDLIIGSDYAGLTAQPSASASASPPASVSATPSVSGSGGGSGSGSGSGAGAASASASASPSASASASPSGVTGLAQSNGGITAAASCSSDSSAFAGPNSP